ncbi:nuclear transport factor 2 family protein [Marimonas sp. MJW-29]|uniref:Nuclear transport factor 2 family protein n=1 Tax=Sulfitobacter sediminis TaxID=3234186 RepID=A0ABV3RKF0_9RHOB
MVTPSPELVAVVRRWNDAMRRKDGRALTNMLSTSEHLLYQGSAEGETWRGPVLCEGFADHAREIPDFDWEETSLEAFEMGNVGWAHCLANLRFHSNGKLVPCRFTFVLVIEDGIWRMIQMHGSNGFPNMEKMGTEHAALDRLVKAAREGFSLDQREGLATVMFTDIVNSSGLAAAVGDRIWTATVSAHFRQVTQIVTDQGGQLVKSLGDGTMSSFTSARAALAAARDIQRQTAATDSEPPLTLRIGLHSGDVIQTKDDFFGNVVNKAARIASAAAPGEIRISDACRLMSAETPDLTFDDPVETELAGIAGRHVLFRLNW